MNPMEVAVRALGVHVRTFTDWLSLLTFAELALMTAVFVGTSGWLALTSFEFTFDHIAGAMYRGVLAALVVIVCRFRLEQTGELQARRGDLINLMRETPDGAPRLVEVPCQCGRDNRYLYTPNGWEHAGPAVDNRR